MSGEKNPAYTHGGRTINRPEYNSWRAMIDRCNNPKNVHYHLYGGRGITICDRWQKPAATGFINFLEDMGKKPFPKMSIDRINNDKGYEPSNCRWASQSEQMLNSSKAKRYAIDGFYMTLKQHVERLGDRSVSFVYKKMYEGLSIEDALHVKNEGHEKVYAKIVADAIDRRDRCPVCDKKNPRKRSRYCSKECFRTGRWGK